MFTAHKYTRPLHDTESIQLFFYVLFALASVLFVGGMNLCIHQWLLLVTQVRVSRLLHSSIGKQADNDVKHVTWKNHTTWCT